MIIDEIDLKKLNVIENKIDAWQEQRLAWMKDTFPVGSTLQFLHNGWFQEGEVLGHCNAFWVEPFVKIRNVRTGTERRVSLFSIKEAYES